MYTSKIIGAETVFYQASNSYFVDVKVEIYKVIPPETPGENSTEELVEVRKFGYPVGTNKEEIYSELEKLCASLASDKEVSARSSELEDILAEAETLKNELLSPRDEEVT